MTPRINTGNRSALFTLAALIGGIAWLVLAIIQATNPTFDELLESPIDYANDGSFTIALICTAVAAIGLGRLGIARNPTMLVAAGYLLVSVGVIAGLVRGESPGWFVVVGLPGNLLALVGMLWLGVSILRGRQLPPWVGVLAILAGLFAVVFAEMGTSVIAAAFWLYIGVSVLAPARAAEDLVRPWSMRADESRSVQ